MINDNIWPDAESRGWGLFANFSRITARGADLATTTLQHICNRSDHV
jgi:hypothetical protein